MCIEEVLLLTASSPGGSFLQSVGHRLSLKLLSCCLPCVYTALSPDKPDALSAAALRMLTAVVMQGSAIARELMNGFDFSVKQLQHLPSKAKVVQVH